MVLSIPIFLSSKFLPLNKLDDFYPSNNNFTVVNFILHYKNKGNFLYEKIMKAKYPFSVAIYHVDECRF